VIAPCRQRAQPLRRRRSRGGVAGWLHNAQHRPRLCRPTEEGWSRAPTSRLRRSIPGWDRAGSSPRRPSVPVLLPSQRLPFIMAPHYGVAALGEDVHKYAGLSLHTPPVPRYPAPLFPFSPAATARGMRLYDKLAPSSTRRSRRASRASRISGGGERTGMRRGSTAYVRLPFPVITPGLIVHRRTCREHHCIRERPSRSQAANRKGARVHVRRGH